VEAGAGGADEVQEWLADLLDWRGMEAGLAEDLAALPGINQVGRLLELEKLTRDRRFDVLVVDAPALDQFLDLPGSLEAAARWAERLFAPRQQTVLEPFLRAFAGEYATAGEDIVERGRDLLGRLARLRDLLTDRSISSVRLVTAADAAALPAVREALAVLSVQSYGVEAVVLNRVLPEEVTDPFFAPLRREEESVIQEISGFGAPVLRSILTPARPQAPHDFAALARHMYGEYDPASVLHSAPGHSVSRDDDGTVLTVPAPFVSKEHIRLEQLDDGILVHVNGRRCALPLDERLRYKEAASWSLEDDQLRVRFR
jgi:arsenite/tail-anchored protein-transporting ATPase